MRESISILSHPVCWYVGQLGNHHARVAYLSKTPCFCWRLSLQLSVHPDICLTPLILHLETPLALWLTPKMALILHHPSPCHHQGTWWDEYGLTACKPESSDAGGVSITQSRQDWATFHTWLSGHSHWLGYSYHQHHPRRALQPWWPSQVTAWPWQKQMCSCSLVGLPFVARLNPWVGIVTALFILWKAVEFDSVAWVWENLGSVFLAHYRKPSLELWEKIFLGIPHCWWLKW